MKYLLTKIKRRLKAKFRKKRSDRVGKLYSNKRTTNKGKNFRLRNTTLGIFIILSVLSLLFWFGYLIYSLKSTKLQRAFKDEKVLEKQEWRGERRINILLVGLDRREGEFGFVDSAIVVMFDPANRSVGIFDINPDIVISRAGQEVKIRNLYNQGILEADKAPIYVLSEEIEKLLAIDIHRYVIVDEDGLTDLVDALGGVYVSSQKEVEDDDIPDFYLGSGSYRLSGVDFLNFMQSDDDGVENKYLRQLNAVSGFLKKTTSYSIFLRLPSFLNIVKNSVYTNLSISELIRAAYEFTNLNEIKEGFTHLSSLQTELDYKAGVKYYPVYEQLDVDVQQVFIDSRISKEQARVELFNSTSIKGLAATRARRLKNVGLDVIRIGDSAEVFESTTIFTRESNLYFYTIDAIKNSLQEDVEVREGELPNFTCTGDVIIVLGENVIED